MDEIFASGHFDVVFHLAAYGVNGWTCDARQAMLTNAIGTTNMLEACRELTLDAFVYAGTCFEYAGGPARCREDTWPKPVNAYALSKTTGWMMAQYYERMHHIPVVGVRPFQVYGPHEAPERLVPSVILSALRGQEVRVTEGAQVRDFIFVEDVVMGLLRAAACKKARGVMLNLGTGHGVTVRTVIETLIGMLGRPVSVAYGAVAYRPGEIWNLVADTRVATRLLGWQPAVSLDEGLRRTVEWCVHRPPARALHVLA